MMSKVKCPECGESYEVDELILTVQKLEEYQGSLRNLKDIAQEHSSMTSKDTGYLLTAARCPRCDAGLVGTQDEANGGATDYWFFPTKGFIRNLYWQLLTCYGDEEDEGYMVDYILMKYDWDKAWQQVVKFAIDEVADKLQLSRKDAEDKVMCHLKSYETSKGV